MMRYGNEVGCEERLGVECWVVRAGVVRGGSGFSDEGLYCAFGVCVMY